MKTNVELVTEFREIIDSIVALDPVRMNAIKQPIRNSPGKVVDKVGLTFFSLEGSAQRQAGMMLSESHVWGAIRKTRLAGHAALMSLESSEHCTESITRTWTTFGPIRQFGGVVARKLIADSGLLDDAVCWLKSPHFSPRELVRLEHLSPEEMEEVRKTHDLEASEYQAQLEQKD